MRRIGAMTTLAALLAIPLHPRAQSADTLKDVLKRTAAYMTEYEPQLTSVLAEEHYEQTSTDGATGAQTLRRVLDSDFAFLRLPGASAWLGQRDTFRVDGRDIPSTTPRLRELLVGGTTREEALRIVRENTRRNLGDLTRTINVPTVALDFFTGDNRSRFRLKKSGEERSGDHRIWTVDYDEKDRPTIIRTVRGADQRARGTVWIDPSTGAIERTVLNLGDDSRADEFVRTRITVRFEEDRQLGFRVPADMVESYYRPRSRDYEQLQIVAHATYSNFRRFQTSGKLLPP